MKDLHKSYHALLTVLGGKPTEKGKGTGAFRDLEGVGSLDPFSCYFLHKYFKPVRF